MDELNHKWLNSSFPLSGCSDYDALRSLDDEIAPEDPIMSEEAINVLPVHGIRAQPHMKLIFSQLCSSSWTFTTPKNL